MIPWPYNYNENYGAVLSDDAPDPRLYDASDDPYQHWSLSPPAVFKWSDANYAGDVNPTRGFWSAVSSSGTFNNASFGRTLVATNFFPVAGAVVSIAVNPLAGAAVKELGVLVDKRTGGYTQVVGKDFARIAFDPAARRAYGLELSALVKKVNHGRLRLDGPSIIRLRGLVRRFLAGS